MKQRRARGLEVTAQDADLHLYPAAVAWTLGGLIGATFRILLFFKFVGDLRLSAQLAHIDGLRVQLSKRALETTILHLSIKLGIIVIGFIAMFQAPPVAATQAGLYSVLVTAFLVLIPWVLVYDAAREYFLQIELIGAHKLKETPDGS